MRVWRFLIVSKSSISLHFAISFFNKARFTHYAFLRKIIILTKASLINPLEGPSLEPQAIVQAKISNRLKLHSPMLERSFHFLQSLRRVTKQPSRFNVVL